MAKEQQERFPAGKTELLLAPLRARKIQSVWFCTPSAFVALFHELVSKATEGLVSSCGRTMVYADIVFSSPKGKE